MSEGLMASSFLAERGYPQLRTFDKVLEPTYYEGMWTTIQK